MTDPREALRWERPTEVRARRTVDALEQALEQCLTRTALSDVTVSDLCREAGVHRTTFYGHFSGVPELVRAVYVDRLRGEVDDRAGSELPAEQALLLRHEHVLEAVLAGFTDRPAETVAMFGPDGDLGVQQVLMDVVRGACTAAIDEWVRRGVEVPVPPDAAATMYAYAFLGQVHRWMESELADPRVITEEMDRFLPSWWPRRERLLQL